MNIMNRRKIRSNRAQISHLCIYMQEHPEFASGEYRSPHSAADIYREWKRLAAELNELGPHRSIGQWKICWRDQKRKSRVESEAILYDQNTTRNSPENLELKRNPNVLFLQKANPVRVVSCDLDEPHNQYQEVPLSSPQYSETSELLGQQDPGPSIEPTSPQQATNENGSNIGRQNPVRPRSVSQLRRSRQRPNRQVDGKFLAAQIENNNLLRELVNEVRRSNELREEHLRILVEMELDHEDRRSQKSLNTKVKT